MWSDVVLLNYGRLVARNASSNAKQHVDKILYEKGSLNDPRNRSSSLDNRFRRNFDMKVGLGLLRIPQHAWISEHLSIWAASSSRLYKGIGRTRPQAKSGFKGLYNIMATNILKPYKIDYCLFIIQLKRINWLIVHFLIFLDPDTFFWSLISNLHASNVDANFFPLPL